MLRCVWRINRTLLSADMEFIRDRDERGILGNEMHEKAMIIRDGYQEAYFSTTDIDYLAKLGRGIEKEFDRLRERYIKIIGKFRDTLRQSRRRDYARVKDLREEFDVQQQLLTRIFAYFKSTRPEVFEWVAEQLLKRLTYHEFLTILSDVRLNAIDRARSDLYAVKVNQLDEEEYLYRHAWQFYLLSRTDAIKQLREEVRSVTRSSLQEQMRAIDDEKRRLQNAQRALQLGHDLNEKALIIRDGAHFRQELKTCWAAGELLLEPLLEEIGRRHAIPTGEILWYTVAEIHALLGEKARLHANEIARRKECTLLLWDGEITYAYGEEAERAITTLPIERPTSPNQVRGKVAHEGRVTANVHVLRGRRTLPTGEYILVTSALDPSMKPALTNCVGIIADEGGLTSHASIVARELGKPCIVGTVHASQVFSDGALVELDAITGVARVVDIKEQL